MDDVRKPEPQFKPFDTKAAIEPPRRRLRRVWTTALIVSCLAAAIGISGQRLSHTNAASPGPSPSPPDVTTSLPLQETVQPTIRFLGQFSAVSTVELRAQVGGTLTAINFKDGQIVHAGDPLFVIDPRPFQIRLNQAVAQLQSAEAKAVLTAAELWRAQQLKRSDFGSAETVDMRMADDRAAQAAIDAAKATIMDASLDLEYARIAAPFTGRMGRHLVSVGSLVSGSRGGTSSTTMLATIVSLDPIFLDFDMSESDYLLYQDAHHGSAPHDDVAISFDGGNQFNRHGTFDFVDNAVNRSSGTIHARATVANSDLDITPGQFARLRVNLGHPGPVLLIPAAAVVPDQSRQVVMTVGPDNSVIPKLVEIGETEHGLRVIRAGLAPTDRVVINGLARVRPGAKVTPISGQIASPTIADAE